MSRKPLKDDWKEYPRFLSREQVDYSPLRKAAWMFVWALLVACFSLMAPSAQAQRGDSRTPGAGSNLSDSPSGNALPAVKAADSSSSAQPAPAVRSARSSSGPKPARASASPAPQASSPANQFIFYAPNGASLSSSPVVSWDSGGQQMVFSPDTSAGGQAFIDVNPTTFQANCGTSANPTQIQSDVDGTLYFLGHCGGDTAPGIERFFFRLDSSGSLALVGSNYGTLAGGIGTDLNGDTCLLYVNNDGTFAPNQSCGNVATVFAPSTGLATQYAGLPSGGTPSGVTSNGFPFIVKAIDAVLTGSVSNYTVFTTAASGYGGPGLYRLEAYIVATAPAPGATMAFTVSYNDGQANQTLMSGSPVYLDTQGAFMNFSQPFYVAASTPIVASTIATNSPTYHIIVRLIAE